MLESSGTLVGYVRVRKTLSAQHPTVVGRKGKRGKKKKKTRGKRGKKTLQSVTLGYGVVIQVSAF